MTNEEAINYYKQSFVIGESDDERHHNEVLEFTIKALEQQDRIIQILDDCDLEAWEILEKIKEVVKA